MNVEKMRRGNQRRLQAFDDMIDSRIHAAFRKVLQRKRRFSRI